MKGTSQGNIVPPMRDDGTVMAAWESFLTNGGVPINAISRMIEDSWRRCLTQGVNPTRRYAPIVVDDNGLYGLRKRHAELLEAAMPVMEEAREFLSETGTFMALTDPKGVVLCLEGDAAAKDRGHDIKLIPGAQWIETASGTNGIGTALAAGRPVQISAAEHFCEGNKHWSCSATVIRDPLDGHIMGVLDLSGLSGYHNQHCMALVVAGAGRIEAKLGKIEMEKRSRLLDKTYHQNRQASDTGIIIFDRRGRLVRANEHAAEALRERGVSFEECEKIKWKDVDLGEGNDIGTLHQWLEQDWVEPVLDADERLGTLISIPLSSRRILHRVEGFNIAAVKDAEACGDIFSRIIGVSPIMTKVKNRARQLSRINVPVLLQGPTGAGKEVFSKALHEGGPMAKGPFIPFNCGGITRDLLASELFGYIDGAFTGAKRGGMIGKFEAANGGTLFLDEIGEMPLDLQPHFLRVLEEGEVYRLGENKPRKVNVRLVAATNRDLRTEVAEGRFRMDLFYRLSVTVLGIPGLCERSEDIPLLVDYFIDRAAKAYNIERKQPDTEVLDALVSYDWPGNVRELKNVVEGMVLLSEGTRLTVDDLPPELQNFRPVSSAGSVPSGGEAKKFFAPVTLDESEKITIASAIANENGNLTRVANRLGIAKSTLYQKMKRYGLDRSSAARE